MDANNVKNNLDAIFENFKNMIQVETVVGEPMIIGDTTIIPFVDVVFGFGSGAHEGKSQTSSDHSGGGGGATLKPTAVLVIKGDRMEMFSISGNIKTSGFERLIGMVPDLVAKMQKDKYIYINEQEG